MKLYSYHSTSRPADRYYCPFDNGIEVSIGRGNRRLYSNDIVSAYGVRDPDTICIVCVYNIRHLVKQVVEAHDVESGKRWVGISDSRQTGVMPCG